MDILGAADYCRARLSPLLGELGFQLDSEASVTDAAQERASLHFQIDRASVQQRFPRARVTATVESGAEAYSLWLHLGQPRTTAEFECEPLLDEPTPATQALLRVVLDLLVERLHAMLGPRKVTGPPQQCCGRVDQPVGGGADQPAVKRIR